MLATSSWISIAMAVVVAVKATTESEIPVCGNRHSRQELDDTVVTVVRHELTCPVRAVCADEWITVRDWMNGTRCREQRVVVNCVCPEDLVCPVGDENHLLYDNKKHRMYTCEPRCNLAMCTTRLRAAEELVQYSPDFGNFNYYRVNCRCPGHNHPLDPIPGQLIRATSYKRQTFNRSSGVTYSEYRCAGNEPLPGEDTVCRHAASQRRGGLNFGLFGEEAETDNWA